MCVRQQAFKNEGCVQAWWARLVDLGGAFGWRLGWGWLGCPGLADSKLVRAPRWRYDLSLMTPTRLSLALLFGICFAASAADLPAIPSQPIARKTALRFADDFATAEADPLWHRVVPTFVREQGALKGTQTRDRDQPSADGKTVIKAHAAVHGLELPTRDSVVEARIRFDGATMIDVEFDDRKYTGAHYGHLCRAQVRLNGVTVIDERDGGMRNDIL